MEILLLNVEGRPIFTNCSAKSGWISCSALQIFLTRKCSFYLAILNQFLGSSVVTLGNFATALHALLLSSNASIEFGFGLFRCSLGKLLEIPGTFGRALNRVKNIDKRSNIF